MDPLVGSAIIAGVSSLVSGLFGTLSGNKNIDKQIEAQSSENQKVRDYNLNLAKMQNQWNLDQWNRENEYNTPKAQMQRLTDAGLNPDLFYQNGVSGMTAASSPSMTAGAPATPQDMSALGQKKTVGQAMQEALQSSLLGAEIELKRSEARKNDSQAEGQDLTNMNILSMDNAKISQLLSSAGLNSQQVAESQKRIDEINQNIQQMAENVRYLYTLRQNASEQQTMNWLMYEWYRQDHVLRQRLGWQEYNQSKQLFQYSLKSAKYSAVTDEYVSKMQEEMYDLFLKSPEHYSVEWFNSHTPEQKEKMYDFTFWNQRLNDALNTVSTVTDIWDDITRIRSPKSKGTRTYRRSNNGRSTYTETQYIF